MSPPAPSFRMLLRVRYAECDQQGIVSQTEQRKEKA